MCPSCWILHVIAALKQAYPPYQSKLDKSLPSPPSGGQVSHVLAAEVTR